MAKNSPKHEAPRPVGYARKYLFTVIAWTTDADITQQLNEVVERFNTICEAHGRLADASICSTVALAHGLGVVIEYHEPIYAD